TTATMSARAPADDVISISSSPDSDSDCQIVKVVPSPVKRGKNRSTRWKRQPSTNKTNRQPAMTDRRGREMKIRQREQADDRDRLRTKTASRAHGKWLNEDSMERRRDDVCHGALQGTKQRIVKDGHLSLMGEDAQASRRHCVDPKLSTASFPFLSHGVECKQEVRHQGDDSWGVRSRSCSTVTLDFSPRMSAVQIEDDTELRRDEQEMFSMFDGSSETIDLVDAAPRCPVLNPEGAVSSSSADPTPSLKSTSILKDELDATRARLTRKRRSRRESPANDDPFRSTDGSQHRIGSWLKAHKDRHQLVPRKRSGPIWDTIVNVTAFDALPGPFFTRPKNVMRDLTHKDAMKERAKRRRKQGLNV
ncbi:hypothetical protein BBK36DRAFT_1198049, partial [Trichoderma citrinoviride]